MTPGVRFDHAAYQPRADSETVLLVYTLGETTRGCVGYGYFVTRATGAIRTMEEVYQWVGYEYVSINGLTALYCKMCWDEKSVGYDVLAYFRAPSRKKSSLPSRRA